MRTVSPRSESQPSTGTPCSAGAATPDNAHAAIQADTSHLRIRSDLQHTGKPYGIARIATPGSAFLREPSLDYRQRADAGLHLDAEHVWELQTAPVLSRLAIVQEGQLSRHGITATVVPLAVSSVRTSCVARLSSKALPVGTEPFRSLGRRVIPPPRIPLPFPRKSAVCAAVDSVNGVAHQVRNASQAFGRVDQRKRKSGCNEGVPLQSVDRKNAGAQHRAPLYSCRRALVFASQCKTSHPDSCVPAAFISPAIHVTVQTRTYRVPPSHSVHST
ncbi:hypothetical protein NM688_g5962 [Phlebia brevispora]|uniref:Uncharacterized protein n=1 Tax=Phlebia brevispora TaxID=194682 RepID=A0ACC1SMF0_9APHY|nr:hypothetical protein NM688_g5962 [Phlebia brevispora]